MVVVCTTKDNPRVSTSEIVVGMSRGYVRVTAFTPNETLFSLTASQAIELGIQLVKCGWDQR